MQLCRQALKKEDRGMDRGLETEQGTKDKQGNVEK